MRLLVAALEAVTQECADARIWAGAHFPSANEESRPGLSFAVDRHGSLLPPWIAASLRSSQ